MRSNCRPVISLMGTFGESNTGDDILLVSTIFGLRQKFPGCRIIIFTGCREHTRQLLLREGMPLDSFELVYTGRRGVLEPALPFFQSLAWVWENARWIRRSDLFLIGPGTQLQDVTRRFRLLFFLGRAILALALRTPYAFIGLGYWKVGGWLCRTTLRFTGNRAVFLSTRDRASASALTGLGIRRSRIVALADVSFFQGPVVRGRQEIDSPGPLIGWTARCFPKEGFSDQSLENFEESLASLLDWVWTEYRGRFLFFPFYQASSWSDLRAFKSVRSRIERPGFPVEICCWKTLGELGAKIAACDGFIGTRLHSVFLAVQAGVPTLALSYARKAWNFMSENGLGEHAVPVEEVSPEILRERWDILWKERNLVKAKLAAVCQNEQRLARRHFDLVEVFSSSGRHFFINSSFRSSGGWASGGRKDL